MTEFHLLSSLEKVIPHNYEVKGEHTETSALLGERVSFRIAYRSTKAWMEHDYKIRIDSPVSDFISVRNVETVPVDLPCQKTEFDDDYLTTEPAILPDILAENKTKTIESIPTMWRTLWVTVEPDCTVGAGTYPVNIVFEGVEETVTTTFTVRYKGLLALGL